MTDMGFNVKIRIIDGSNLEFFNVTSTEYGVNNLYLHSNFTYEHATIPVEAVDFVMTKSTDVGHNKSFPFIGKWKPKEE